MSKKQYYQELINYHTMMLEAAVSASDMQYAIAHSKAIGFYSAKLKGDVAKEMEDFITGIRLEDLRMELVKDKNLW